MSGCLCQEPGPGITKTWQEKKSRPGPSSSMPLILWATSDSLRADGTPRARPGSLGKAQNPLKGDGTVRPWWSYGPAAAAPLGLFKLGCTSRRFPSRPRFQVLLLPSSQASTCPRRSNGSIEGVFLSFLAFFTSFFPDSCSISILLRSICHRPISQAMLTRLHC